MAKSSTARKMSKRRSKMREREREKGKMRLAKLIRAGEKSNVCAYIVYMLKINIKMGRKLKERKRWKRFKYYTYQTIL